MNLLKSAPVFDEAGLVQKFNDAEFSNSTVVYLRLITSCQVRRKADDFFRKSRFISPNRANESFSLPVLLRGRCKNQGP